MESYRVGDAVMVHLADARLQWESGTIVAIVQRHDLWYDVLMDGEVFSVSSPDVRRPTRDEM